MEYNRIVSPNKFIKIALAMGERIDGASLREASKKAIDAIKNIIAEVNVPNNLSSLGVEKERLSDIADRANQSPNTPDNPRTINKEEYLRIIEKAYE
jgi:alcohol dehydrogenase class IV